MPVHKQGTTNQPCLNEDYRLMLVLTQGIQSHEIETEGRVQANRWMRGLNSTTLHSMPPVPLFELHFSILTPMLAQSLKVRALTYTTQVRSSGSQVFVGYRNHRAEPVSVLRRSEKKCRGIRWLAKPGWRKLPTTETIGETMMLPSGSSSLIFIVDGANAVCSSPCAQRSLGTWSCDLTTRHWRINSRGCWRQTHEAVERSVVDSTGFSP